MSDREMYLGALAGEYDGELPPPSTRSLKWMAKMLGQDVETEPVQSAEEAYWKEFVENGGGTVPEGSLAITQNGTYDVTEKAEAVVAVPNTYTAADNGKVVQNQALVSQTNRPTSITANGTYTTTTYNSVTVAIPVYSGAYREEAG